MTIGPGKYDDLCTYVRERSGAAVALVIVVGGNKGDGFAVQLLVPNALDNAAQARLTRTHAKALRIVADTMEQDAARMEQDA